MKKLCFVFAVMALSASGANAACSENIKTYVSCKPGYYYDSSLLKTCTRCPASGGVYGTSADKNIDGVTSCYLPAGTTGSDDTGTFKYTADCYYAN